MKTKISTVAVLLALAGPLQATLWTTPQTVSVSLTDSTDATLDFSQFDSTLGTLVGVSISYSRSFTGTTVNMHNNQGSGNITGTGKLSIANNSVTSSADMGPLDPGTIGYSKNFSSSTYTIGAGLSQLWNPGVLVKTVSGTLTSANADLTGYYWHWKF